MKASNSTALTVRVAADAEAAAFDAQLTSHHYLGAGRPVGDYLRQFVERDGVPVALLVWGAQLLRAQGSGSVDRLERVAARVAFETGQ